MDAGGEEKRERASSARDSTRIRALVERCLERVEMEGEEAIEAFCSEYPAEASQIRRKLDGLRRMGLLGASVTARDAQPERLGEFRLIERLGSGGMGIVYRAEQESMGREVALKLIRPEHLYFPGAQARFRREVEAIARLHHPSIVPVHTVGEEDGVPYFAMELVAGISLAEALAQLQERSAQELAGDDLQRVVAAGCEHRGLAVDEVATGLFRGGWVRTCFRIVHEVAGALEHAHQHGVIHRDVKPSNIMLTPNGRVLLLDFGLAHSAGTHRLTRTGSQLGSVPYMAPEQLRGDPAAIGAHTDIYGLGVVLYELLSLSAPYLGETLECTREAILAAHPQSLAGLNPGVAWDAETICLTAMDPDDARRYSSARALAEDVENYLELRPIVARRPGAPLRLRRWAQRHPALVSALAVAALGAVLGPLIFGIQQARAASRLRTALEETGRQQERAEAMLREAIAAVNLMLGRTAQERLAGVPQMDEVRRQLLEDALAFYERLAEADAAGTDLRYELARAHLSIGDLQRQMGRTEEAAAALNAALVSLRAMIAENPALRSPRRLLAAALHVRGMLEYRLGQFDAAMGHWREGIAILDGLLEAMPGERMCRSLQSNLLMSLSTVLVKRGLMEEAEGVTLRAVALREALVAEDPEDLKVLVELGVGIQNLGNLSRIVGNVEAAREQYRRALEHIDAAVRTGDHGPRGLVAQVSINLSLAYLAMNEHDFEDAELHLRCALGPSERLCRDFPMRTDYWSYQARVHSGLGEVLQAMGREGQAEAQLRAAIQVQERLASEAASTPDYQLQLAQSHGQLASLLASRGVASKASEQWDCALEILRTLQQAHPRAASPYLHAGTTRAMRAAHEFSQEHWEVAKQLCEEAVVDFREAQARRPGDVEIREQCAQTLILSGEVLIATGQLEEAVRHLRAAFTAGELAARHLGMIREAERLEEREDYRALLREARSSKGR